MSTKIYYPGTGASKTLIGTIGNTQTKATLATSTKYMENDLVIEQVMPIDRIETKTITAAAWTQSGDAYTQTITFTTPTTVNTIVDVSGSYANIREFVTARADNFYVENDNGTFKLYSIGAKPSVDVTLQFCLAETE